MLRALLWKEWRQLRALRIAGLALGVVLPLALLGGAAAARNGFAPFGRVGGNETRTILLEVHPAFLALGLWPLVALLVVSQAFAGDRSSGVEAFLLDRPVSRGRTWSARLVSSLGSALAIAAGTWVVWFLFVWLSGNLAAGEWGNWGGIFAFGGVLTALAFAGTIAAAAAVTSPFAAVLLGLLFSVVPMGVALALGSRFPLAQYRGAQVGLILPWLLVPALFLASYLALCRGEPAGRGRMVRFGSVLGAALVAILAAFLVLAPVFVRLEARRLGEGARVFASAGGRTAFVMDEGWEDRGGWIVDVATGERKRFVAPPVYKSSAWNADGTMIALVTASGPLGSKEADPRLEFLDSTGRSEGRPVRLPEASWWEAVRWADRHVVVRTWHDRKMGLAVVDPATGAVREPDLRKSYWRLGLLQPGDGGRLFVAIGAAASSEEALGNAPRARDIVDYTVHRLDVESGRIDGTPIVRDTGQPWRAEGRLSPSGRYWLVDRSAGRCDARPLLDLSTGNEIPPQSPHVDRAWLEGDRLAWLESNDVATWLLMSRPGESPSVLRGWKRAHAKIEASPDRKLLLVRTVPPGKPELSWGCPDFTTPSLRDRVPDAEASETLVYEAATGKWVDVSWVTMHGRRYRAFSPVWAGPRTLAHTGRGLLAFEDVDRPGVLRDVIGHVAE
jgi:hypothetical protein